MNSLSFSRFNYDLDILIANPLFSPFFPNPLWVHYKFTNLVSYILREFTMNSLSFSQIRYKFTNFFPNSLWIHYEVTIFLANTLRIHYLFLESSINSQAFSRILFEFTLNSLSFSRILFEFTICIANTQWITYISRELAMIS